MVSSLVGGVMGSSKKNVRCDSSQAETRKPDRRAGHARGSGFLATAAIISVFCIGEVQATTYYVNKAAGNDAAAGTSVSTAWATIGKANTTLRAGDTVYIRAGTYYEAIMPANSGTAGNPITYCNYPGESPLIDGGSSLTACVMISGLNYITVDGFRCHGGWLYWWRLVNSSRCIIKNCTFWYIGGANKLDVGSLENSHYNQILDNSFDGGQPVVFAQQDLMHVFNGSSHNLIEGNYFGYASHNDIMMRYGCDYNVFRSNVFENKWHTGFSNYDYYSFPAYCVFENNVARNCGIEHYSCPDPADAAKTISLHNACGWGPGPKSICRNNVFYNNGLGMALGGHGVITDTKVYHNSFYRNWINMSGNASESTLNGNVFVNNLLYEHQVDFEDGIHYYDYDIYIYVTLDPYSHNVWTKNNIASHMSGALSSSILYGYSAPYFVGTLAQLQATMPSDWYGNYQFDPQFVNPAGGNLNLQPTSPAIDAGTHLTLTTNAGNNSTTLTVADAGYFFSGSGAPWYVPGTVGDTIYIEGAGSRQIASINHDTNTITLASPMTWASAKKVYHRAYSGNAPDIGAFEYQGTSLNYTLTISATNGTVSKTPDLTSYTAGQTVTLQATPNTGYTFSGWSGDLTGTANPTIITMGGDRWVTADFVSLGAPEVTVLGNGLSIADGDTTPSTNDYTDFGSVVQGGSAISRAFVVQNVGTANLTLGTVTVPTGFTLTEGLSSSLAAGASDTFTVRLDTAAIGTKTGTVSFATNDSDENPFNFTITGTITANDSNNLALGKTAVASSIEDSGLAASNATDGDLITRWSSLFSDPQWLYVDLGSVYTVDEIVLRWETAYGKSYQLQVSNDASNWTTVYSTASGNGDVDDITLGSPASGRYVRVYGTERGTQWGYSIHEMGVYAAPQIYTLSISATNGTVTKTPNQASYASGQIVTLQATPNAGYTFSGWSGDLTSTANPATLTMDSNKSVTASFSAAPAPTTYTLTVSATNGTVTKTPNQASYASGQIVTLQATPNAGYVFSGWSGDLTGTTNPVTLTMNANKSVMANFTAITYTLSVSAANGTVTRTPDQTSYTSGQTVTLEATPNAGYTFSGWSGALTGTTNPATLVMNANKSVTANFTAITYSLTVNATNGTVVKTPDQTSYSAGATVTLQATPNTGYSFSGWSGDLTGSVNPATLVMNGNKSVTASFSVAQPGAYYVDRALGNDNNDGKSPATAWQSIGKVNSYTGFVPGDQILLHRGHVWREQLIVPASGTADKPITFGAYDTGDRPLLMGSVWLSSWTSAGPNLWTTSLSTAPDQVFFSGVRGTQMPSPATLAGPQQWSWTAGVLYVYATSDPSSITTAVVEASVQHAPRTSGLIQLQDRSCVTVQDLHVAESASAGIYLTGAGQGLTVRNCEADNSADGGIVATSPTGALSDVTVESCLIHHNNGGLQEAGSVNLALGKTAVASSTETSSLLATNGTDGDLSSRWSSLFSDPQWIYVDLGSVATINRIVLRWEVAYGRSYQLQVSDDATTWSEVYSTTTGDGGVDDITLGAPATGRYVRMLGIQRGTVWGYSLYEFEAYGSGGVLGAATYQDGLTVEGVHGFAVRGCQISDNYGRGVGLEHGSTNGVFENCQVNGNGLVNLYLDGASNTQIRYNKIYDGAAEGGLQFGLQTSTYSNDTIEVYYNLFWNNAGGISFTALADVTSQTRNIRILNNTFYNHPVALHWEPAATGHYSGANNVKNNLLWAQATTNIGIHDETTGQQGLVQTTVAYNGFQQGAATDTVGTNAQVMADPYFTDPSAYDFHRSTISSPTIDTGTDVGLTRDFEGDPVPEGSAPDIGAYEAAGSPAVTYVLTVSATNGTVSKTPDQTNYTAGQTVTLQATPNTGYTFSGWSGDLTGTTNPATLTMDSNKSVTANFIAVAPATYALTISATNGTVSKTPNQTSYTAGQTVTLQATPDTRYVFSGWSGDLTGMTNPATLVMNGNKSVTAAFTRVHGSWKRPRSLVAPTNINTDASQAASADDQQPPVLSDCSPAADSIQVAPDTLLVLRVCDAGQGVDAASVSIQVDGHLIYTGDVTSYRTAYGVCTRAGTEAQYTYVYQQQGDFRYSRRVAVTVQAQDRVGNVMPEQTYSFATEMYSFGANLSVAADQLGLPQGKPATARDGQDTVWIVWHAGSPGSRHVYATCLQPDGNPCGGTVQLSQSAGDHCNPALAIDALGTLYVVWQENAGGIWDVYVSTSVDGQTWSAPKPLAAAMNVSSRPAVNRTHPVVAASRQSSGLVAVAWQEGAAGNQDICVASSTNRFETAAVSRVTSDPADQTDPTIAIDGQDTIVVLWTDARNGSTAIYGAASNAGPWTNVPVVADENSQSHPVLVAGLTGETLHLAWVEDKAGNLDVFYAATEGLPTSPLMGTDIIDDTSGADQQAPALGVAAGADGSDRLFVCWEDARNIAYSGAADVYFADISPGALGVNVLVDDDGTSGSQHEPVLGTDRWGSPYVVWVGDSSTSPQLYYSGATYANPVPLAEGQIVSSAGGLVGTSPKKIKTLDDVSVAIPALACPADATIRAARLRNPRWLTEQSLRPMAFGPGGLVFTQPVTITIPYSPAGRDNIGVCWFDAATGMFRQDGIANVRSIPFGSGLAALQFEATHLGSFYLVSGIAP
jgi:uncharacterized repeat protein (TIGR02543 family)